MFHNPSSLLRFDSAAPDKCIKLIIKTAKIMNEFDYKGHHYKVVNVENSTDCIIIKDGRQTRRVSKAIADHAMENVDKLFK